MSDDADALLPTPTKIGVALAVLAALLILILPLLFIYRRRKRRQTLRSAQALRRQTLDLTASPAASLVFNRRPIHAASDLPYTPSPIDERSHTAYYDRTPDTASVEMVHVQPAVTVTVPKAGLLRAKSPSRRSTPTSPTSPSTSRPRTADRRSSASASPVASRPNTSGSMANGWTRTSSDKRLSLRPSDRLHPDLEAALQKLEREQRVQDVSPRPFYIPTIAPPAPVATLTAAQRSHSQPQIPTSPSRGTLRRAKRPPPQQQQTDATPTLLAPPTPMPRSASAPDASLAPHHTFTMPPTSFPPISTAPPSSFMPPTSYVTPPTPTTPTTTTATLIPTTPTPATTATPPQAAPEGRKPRKKPSRPSSDIIPPPASPHKEAARVSRSQSLAMDHDRDRERGRERSRAHRVSARPPAI